MTSTRTSPQLLRRGAPHLHRACRQSPPLPRLTAGGCFARAQKWHKDVCSWDEYSSYEKTPAATPARETTSSRSLPRHPPRLRATRTRGGSNLEGWRREGCPNDAKHLTDPLLREGSQWPTTRSLPSESSPSSARSRRWCESPCSAAWRTCCRATSPAASSTTTSSCASPKTSTRPRSSSPTSARWTTPAAPCAVGASSASPQRPATLEWPSGYGASTALELPPR